MNPEPSAFACAIFLVIAFTIAGLAHSAWLRTRVSRRLFIPLDGGLTLRGRRVFGENKTIRGFVSMVPAAAGAFALCIAVARWAFPELAAELWPLTTAGYVKCDPNTCRATGRFHGEWLYPTFHGCSPTFHHTDCPTFAGAAPRRARIDDLTEQAKAATTLVTNKLHLLPADKFPLAHKLHHVGNAFVSSSANPDATSSAMLTLFPTPPPPA